MSKNFLTGMKKTLLLIILLMLSVGVITNAQTSTTSSTKNKINDLKQKIFNIKATVKEEKIQANAEIASTTNAIKTIKQELKTAAEIRIGKKLDAQKAKIADVFEIAIRNLKSLATRTESRIIKMELQSINASSSRALLNTANTKITLADTELTNLENLLAHNLPVASTSTSKNAERKLMLKNINVQSEKTKTAIKTAHKAIVGTINSLKKGLEKQKHATSTTETSTSTNN